jgi:hypothetical protein
MGSLSPMFWLVLGPSKSIANPRIPGNRNWGWYRTIRDAIPGLRNLFRKSLCFNALGQSTGRKSKAAGSTPTASTLAVGDKQRQNSCLRKGFGDSWVKRHCQRMTAKVAHPESGGE